MKYNDKIKSGQKPRLLRVNNICISPLLSTLTGINLRHMSPGGVFIAHFAVFPHFLLKSTDSSGIPKSGDADRILSGVKVVAAFKRLQDFKRACNGCNNDNSSLSGLSPTAVFIWLQSHLVELEKGLWSFLRPQHLFILLFSSLAGLLGG